MALWCRDLPVVRPLPASQPKAVTLIVPYYDCPVFFARQVAHWANYAPDVRRYLRIIVVDDGSPLPAVKPRVSGVALTLYRIEVDVRWNWLAARNIGAHHADAGWLLLTDMDHLVPEATLRSLIRQAHDPAWAYAFMRREHTGETRPPHSASWFLTRDLYWQVGGYDETLSGYYGTDGDYRRRLATRARLAILPDVLVRHEYVEDASTRRYQRKQPEDAAVRQLIRARRPGWHPRTLTFPYHEVTA